MACNEADVGVALSVPDRVMTSDLSCVVIGRHVDAPLRLGCGYAVTTGNGEPAWMLDLYRRDAILTGHAMAEDIGQEVPQDSLVRVNGVVCDVGDRVLLQVFGIRPYDVGADPDTFVLDLAWPQWIVDQGIVDRARATWIRLSPPFRKLINATLSNDMVMRRFLKAPGSISHHHSRLGGCIEHSVETAEYVVSLATQMPEIDLDLAITGALMHDVGKSIEYVQLRNGRWKMSSYGRNVGHKIAGVQLLTLAMVRCPEIPSNKKERLINILAGSYAPAWVGLRKLATREAELVAGADRLSAQCDR